MSYSDAMLRHRKIFALSIIGIVALFGCATEPSAPSPRAVSDVFSLEEGRSTAPFGDVVSSGIFNYSRISPNVGLAGKLTEAGVREAKALGFALVIDLRQPDEDGVAMEQRVAEEISLSYMNTPMSADDKAWAEIDRIAEILGDARNYPVLIHCGSSNRAGAFWALYRTRQGVNAIVAIEEGRAGGMTSREKQVRRLLGLPPLENKAPSNG